MKKVWNAEEKLKYERALQAKGVQYIAGVDEVGRGPLAGPVVCASVVMPLDAERLVVGVDDSKKLSEKKREKLFDIIKEKAVSWSVGIASPERIDEINILQATFLAMQRAIDQLEGKAKFALIDGNRETDFGIPCQTVIKGDGRSANIAAASVLAKVTRDLYMEELAEKYPQYGFEIHKGYGTKAHYAALTEHGMCDAHRRTFLRKFYGEK